LAQRSIPAIVIYANQVPIEASKVGAAVTVLSGEALRGQNVQTVAQALRQVPGVAVSQSGGRGQFTEVRIRGAEANHLLVLLDGIEINEMGDGGFDFADMPVDDIERIEVIRGPMSGLYGANAHAGVISIVTLSGRGLKRPIAGAKLETGSRQTYSGSVNMRGAAGPFYGSVTVTDYETKGYNISRFGAEPDGSRAFTFTAKGGIDFTDYFNVEGVIRHSARTAQSDPQDFLFGSPTYGYVIDGDAATKYTSTAGRAGATLRLFDGRWVQSANVKIFSERTRGLMDGAILFGADGMRTTFDYKSTILLDTNFAGGERHSLTVLADHRRQEYQPQFDPTHYAKDRTGLAGEYVLDLATDTTLSGAWRQDWNSDFADIFTWRYAVSQRFPATRTRLHASTGKGITDPNFFELFGSLFNLPNPGLVPEQSIGWDAGIEQGFFDNRVVVDVTYFSTEFRDKIELTFDPMLGGFIYVNGTGLARRRGVEVSSTFSPFDWLTATATYTYTHAKNSVGEPEVRRPPHSASFEATATFADRRARATLGVVYNGVRKDFFFAPTGTTLIDLPGATVVRAALSYDVTPWATVFVRAENLFNTHYEEVFSYRAPGFAAYAALKMRLGE
jgi:vitamin B12 transporter